MDAVFALVGQWVASMSLAHPGLHAGLVILGALVVVGQAVVAVTPSQNDDAALAKLEAVPGLSWVVSFLASFAPIQKK